MIRITSGQWKGRGLKTPRSQNTRPSQARLRQALFNSIQAHIPGARVLELFAGSGALSLEALSRGAKEAYLIENASEAISCIRTNATELNALDQVRIIERSVESFFDRQGTSQDALAPSDLILADPPYGKDWELRLLNSFPFEDLLIKGGLFILEWNERVPGIKTKVTLPDKIRCLEKIREKNYSDSMLTTFLRV